MASVEGRVSPEAFQAVMWSLYGTATILAVSRTALRFRQYKTLQLDDFFLVLACASLTAATVLLQIGIPMLYTFEALDLDPLISDIPVDLVNETDRFQKFNNIWVSMSWIALPLVDRLPRLITYWKIVLVVTAVCFAFYIAEAFIAYPYSGLFALACASGPRLQRTLALGAVTTIVDIATDVLIVAIPAFLLWKVKLGTKRKLGLGLFLGLQVIIAIVAIIRVSGYVLDSTFGIVWVILWQLIEAYVAVIMVSLTAFRSVFVSGGSQKRLTHQETRFSASVGRIINWRQREQDGFRELGSFKPTSKPRG